jgi:hypothetical protein|tara:strand:+ start:598 stop:717 length:120 start_codon:yes stop_codon:yes gene_type:complete
MSLLSNLEASGTSLELKKCILSANQLKKRIHANVQSLIA